MTPFKSLTPSTLSREAFIAAFADIYEHSPWVAARTRDLADPAELDHIEPLHARMSAVMLAACQAQQLDLIRAHPDLAGKAAIAGELTEASRGEQASAGLHLCSAEEFERFTRLNQAYQKQFGFPFIMAVKGRDRQQILAAFETRLLHSAATEFTCALNEINTIALLRLQAL